MTDPVEDLKDFVAKVFDGSTQRCMELDELLWQVRLANRHEPRMLNYEVETLPATPTRSVSPPARAGESQQRTASAVEAVPTLEDI